MRSSHVESHTSRCAIDPLLYSDLLAFFRRRARGAHEDLVQETCRRLLEAGSADVVNLRGYAFAIARRVLWGHANARVKARVELPAEEAELCAEPVADTYLGEGLTRALQGLSARTQRALTLHYAEGLSMSEVARRIELPHGTVKSMVRSARLTLHQALRD